MKKSRSVALVLLGIGAAVTLTGCEKSQQDVNYKRNQYANRADCVADWGDKNCPTNSTSSGSGGGMFYMGPHYFWSGGSPMVVGNDGTARAASGTYLNQPGATSSTLSRSSVGVTSGVAKVSSSSISRAGGSTSSISRGGFGSTSSSMSSGG